MYFNTQTLDSEHFAIYDRSKFEFATTNLDSLYSYELNLKTIRYTKGFLDIIFDDQAFVQVSNSGNRAALIGESLVSVEFIVPTEHTRYDLKTNDFVDFLTVIGGVSVSCFLLGYVLVSLIGQKALF